MTKTIAIASRNPVKIQATLNGFQRMFPDEEFTIQSESVPSGVGKQPRSDAETLEGALHRTRNIAQSLQADYWVGIEGGIEDKDGEMSAFAWIVIQSRDALGKSRTGAFFLPKEVASLVRNGKELGEADDQVFGRTNSKQENGAIGLLTRDVIDRLQLYEQAVILALIPFKNARLYSLMNENSSHERRFHAEADRLRSPQRLALMEVDRVVQACLAGIQAQNMLDVGTGSGIFAEAFSKRGLDVAGLDINPEMIPIARSYAPQGNFQAAPAEAIPFPDNAFDLVFLGHVLHETDDALKALQEARRVARQRTAVYEWPYLDEEHGPPLAHRLKPEQIQTLAEEAGFRKIQFVKLTHMALYLLE